MTQEIDSRSDARGWKWFAHRGAMGLVAMLVMIATGLFDAGADPVNAVSIVSSPGDRVFSPNGDGYEDTYSMTWRLSEPVTASVVVTNQAGDTIRTLLSGQP
ncbi:MAG: hypothetical protein AAGA65_31400, partial [Actinomycetota bacterium]